MGRRRKGSGLRKCKWGRCYEIVVVKMGLVLGTNGSGVWFGQGGTVDRSCLLWVELVSLVFRSVIRDSLGQLEGGYVDGFI